MSRLLTTCAFLLVSVGVVAVNAPAVADGWRVGYFREGRVVFRITAGGNPACASYNDRDCLWNVPMSQIRFDSLRPLVCGADHLDKWGSTGYENPGHWCNMARNY